MREPVAFSTLLIESLHLLFREKRLFWFVGLLGLLSVGSYFLSERFMLTFPNETQDVFALFAWMEDHASGFLALALISLVFTLGEAIVRGPLLLVGEDLLLSGISDGKRSPLSRSQLQKGAWQSIFFELLFLFFLSALALFFFFPVWLALRYNHNALPFVFELGTILFFSLSILFSFLKEYAFFYALLGRVPIKSAFDLGLILLKKNLGVSLLFGGLLLGLSLIFTFLLDSAIITGVAFLKEEVLVPALLIFVLSGTFGVFSQILRLLFFHSIAAGKRGKEKVEAVGAQESLPETPTS